MNTEDMALRLSNDPRSQFTIDIVSVNIKCQLGLKPTRFLNGCGDMQLVFFCSSS